MWTQNNAAREQPRDEADEFPPRLPWSAEDSQTEESNTQPDSAENPAQPDIQIPSGQDSRPVPVSSRYPSRNRQKPDRLYGTLGLTTPNHQD